MPITTQSQTAPEDPCIEVLHTTDTTTPLAILLGRTRALCDAVRHPVLTLLQTTPPVSRMSLSSQHGLMVHHLRAFFRRLGRVSLGNAMRIVLSPTH